MIAFINSASLVNSRVTPTNIVSLLNGLEVPINLDVISLDIDSYDLFVLESILEGGYRPKVISMEINEKIPSGIYFTVLFSDDHYWRGDHFYGCSIDAASTLAERHGYMLLSLEYNNALFLRSDLNLGRLKAVSAQDAHVLGYRDRLDRSTLFPWNKDVDNWLFLPKEVALVKIEAYFKNYQGNFEIRLT
jgi:hypothetical protein